MLASGQAVQASLLQLAGTVGSDAEFDARAAQHLGHELPAGIRGRATITTGIPAVSKPVTLATRVIPITGASLVTRRIV